MRAVRTHELEVLFQVVSMQVSLKLGFFLKCPFAVYAAKGVRSGCHGELALCVLGVLV